MAIVHFLLPNPVTPKKDPLNGTVTSINKLMEIILTQNRRHACCRALGFEKKKKRSIRWPLRLRMVMIQAQIGSSIGCERHTRMSISLRMQNEN